MEFNNNYFVSVIIPVYNDSKNLINCLEALRKQTLDQSKFEIIVVDNNSDDDMSQIKKNYSEINFLFESKEGSYAARNMGIDYSKGTIIAFTDSDCIPNSDWLEKGVKNLRENAKFDLIGGKIELFFNDASNLNAIELYEKLYAFNQKQYVHVGKFSATANLFARMSVFKDIGNFDSILKSSGDKEWCIRAYNNGYRLLYAKDVVVKHPSRNSLGDYSKKVVRLIGGKYKLDKKNGVKSHSILINSLLTLIPPVISVLNIFRDRKFQKLNKFSDRLKIIMVFCYTRYLSAYENFRLLLGKKEKN